MKKYGIIQGETEENPIKTASDKIVEEISLNSSNNEADAIPSHDEDDKSSEKGVSQ